MKHPKFDAKAPFGEIHPPHFGAMYEQYVDGVACYFSGSKEFMFRAGQEGTKPAPADKEEAKEEAPAEDPNVIALAPIEVPEPDIPPDPEPIVTVPEPTPEPVIVAWAKGKSFPFFEIKKLVKDTYPDIDTTSAKSIVAGLISHGVINEDEAAR